MKIKWLRKALLNLQEEAEYIAQESPESARHVVGRILEQTERWLEPSVVEANSQIQSERNFVHPLAYSLAPT